METIYKHELDKQARKYIAKLDTPRQRLILEGIGGLPLKGDIKPMRGYKNLYRLRVGGCRALFSLSDEIKYNNETKQDEKIVTVTVQAVDTRGDIY
jgi:mRNA interferase RelE/StbE